MKKILLVVICFCFILNGTEVEEKEETTTVGFKVINEIDFSKSEDTFSVKPILDDENLANEIILKGYYKIDEDNNIKMTLNKLNYENQDNILKKELIKKSKLKKRDVVLESDETLFFKNVNVEEFVDIINNVDTTSSSIASSSNSKGFITSSSLAEQVSSLANSGVYTPFGSNSQKETKTKEDEECPSASYSNGMATFYVKEANKCVKKSTNSVEKKYDTRSCLNKIDYENNKISLGYETFVNDITAGTFLAQPCTYEEPIILSSEIGNCEGIPNFSTKKANVQRKYYYIKDNEKIYLGGCTLTKEYVDLKLDLNSCQDDRHDFVKKVSIAMGKYYYSLNNENFYVGDCVTVPEYTYNHFIDDSTCQYEKKDGRVFYRQRVAYKDMLNSMKFANDCQVITSDGLQIFEEFKGYAYNDNTKQAIRVVDKYFLIPKTTTKMYTDTDVQTMSTYSYEETECKIENNDEERITRKYNQIKFKDTDENKEVILQECTPKHYIAYTQVNQNSEQGFIKNHGVQILTKNSNTYYWEDKKIDLSNGNLPNYSSESIFSITTAYKSSCDPDLHYIRKRKIEVEYSDCSDARVEGTIVSRTISEKCTYRGGSKYTYTFYPYTHKDCKIPSYYYATIGEYTLKQEYLRGDGTKYVKNEDNIFKIIK